MRKSVTNYRLLRSHHRGVSVFLPIRNITPFSAFVPTQDGLVDAKCIIHEPLIVRVDPCVRVSHLQASNSSQLSCCQLSPVFFVFYQHLFHPFQLCRQHVEPVNLRLERQIALSVDQSVRELPSLRVCLEVVELAGRVGGFAIEGIHRRCVQGFAKHLVRVLTEGYDQRVRGHNGLHVVSLLRGGLVRETDGVVDVLGPPVDVESAEVLLLQCSRHVRLLVQRVAGCRESVWGLVGIVRVAIVLYEWVLIWVPVFKTGGATPGSSRRRRTWRRSASQAAFAAFLLCTARANCSSLHCMLTFFGDCGCRSPFAGRDLQYSFSFPKLMIKCLGVGFVSWCGSHPTRV